MRCSGRTLCYSDFGPINRQGAEEREAFVPCSSIFLSEISFFHLEGGEHCTQPAVALAAWKLLTAAA
jgi:hypothetical protein